MEKYKNGWLLSVLRLGASSNKWYFLSPEEAESGVDYANLPPVNFKEIRPLIKQSHAVSNTDALNDVGLPLVSVFMHKNFGA